MEHVGTSMYVHVGMGMHVHVGTSMHVHVGRCMQQACALRDICVKAAVK